VPEESGPQRVAERHPLYDERRDRLDYYSLGPARCGYTNPTNLINPINPINPINLINLINPINPVRRPPS